MKLDCNKNPDGTGKYALVRLREWPHGYRPFLQECFDALVDNDAIDFGNTPDTEFFVIRLKDKYAAPALTAYAHAAMADDPEWAQEVLALATKAENHPHRQRPD